MNEVRKLLTKRRYFFLVTKRRKLKNQENNLSFICSYEKVVKLTNKRNIPWLENFSCKDKKTFFQQTKIFVLCRFFFYMQTKKYYKMLRMSENQLLMIRILLLTIIFYAYMMYLISLWDDVITIIFMCLERKFAVGLPNTHVYIAKQERC